MAYLGNLSSFDHKSGEWAIFKGRLEQFLKVNNVVDGNKNAVLITHLSDESYRLVRNLAYPADVATLTYAKLVALLDSHFAPRQCSFADKANFYGATRIPGEKVVEWAARLRGLASYCDFGAALDRILTDRFVLGLDAGPERDRLFEQSASTLEFSQALEIGQRAESAREAKTFKVKEESLYRASPSYGSRSGRGGGGGGGSGAGSQPRDRGATRCAVCGMKNHSEDQCRFKGYRCQKCGVKGHLKKVCKSEKKCPRVNQMSTDEGNSSDGGSACCHECQNYNLRYVTEQPIKIDLILGKSQVSMELDSGSGKCVISDKMFMEMFSDYKLCNSNLKMCLYDGHKISPVGYFKISAEYNNLCKLIKIYVVKNGGPPLLGRDFMSAFDLVLTTKLNHLNTDCDIHSLLEQYPDLWRNELGSFNKFEVHLKLKENSVPKFFKPRPVPFALKDKVEKELNRLVDLGILVPITHSQYATPVVPVLKENGKVRLAGDYSVTLNKDLIVEKYPLPRIEEVFAKIGGGLQYSKLDLKNAYNQFVLSDSSQDLTTINTQKGLFKYTRLVYGLANAPAIFQRSMETLLSGIEGVSCWIDDICVTGPDKATHLDRLRKVLSKLSDAGLTLQREKCEFFKNSVNYLGYVINKHGLQTCPNKVQAIINAPEPKNVTDIKRFLGLVNYYRNFIPNASSILGPVHELLRTGAEWEWGERQREAVRRVRRELASERVLAHYEPAAQLVLAVDAGPAGLGAVLCQRDARGIERPLAYASRSLAASERNYSQIHKEATAIIFGVKRFHQYLYGRSEPFILKTDHRPLVSIFNKGNGISVTTALRLQRYAIILSAYNYVVQYSSSENNVVADYFSRAPLQSSMCDSDREYDMYCSLKYLDNALPAVMSHDVQTATANDKVLKTVIKYMKNGWPRKINCKSIWPYFQVKNDLQYENGYILRGHRVVIPAALKERLLSELHSTHLGIIKTKCNARSKMWWPGIDGDIERWIGACDTCAALRPAPPREPPAPWPRPAAAWQRIHIDYMSLEQKVYLVVIDAFSKWLECIHMNNGTTTQALIAKLKYIFSVFGIPTTLVSDNDVKINSTEFREFCSSNGIEYITSPIYHPASNGQAENSVRTCKKMLKCILKDNQTQTNVQNKLLSYLFTYRNTTHCVTGETPSKLMFGRNLRTRLDLIMPINKKNTTTQHKCTSKRRFEVGDSVFIRWYSSKKEIWKAGIIKRIIGNRMYEILIKDLNVLCVRHIDQLLKDKSSVSNSEVALTNSSLPPSSSFAPPPPPIVTQPIDSPTKPAPDHTMRTIQGSMEEEAIETEADPNNAVEEGNDCEGEECERGITRAAELQAEPPLAPSIADDAQSSNFVDPSLTRQLRPKKDVDYKRFF